MNEIIDAPQPQSLELRASLEVGKVASNPALLGLIARSTQLAQWKNFKLIENQVQYDQAIDAFAQAKGVLKELEVLRLSVVGFPTKVVSLINALFKSVRDGVEGYKGHIGGIINVKKQADAAAAKRAADIVAASAALVADQPPQVVESAGGESVVQFEPAPIVVPGNVVESLKGAKVHTRVDTEVTITNMEALLKVIVSKSKRNAWLNENLEALVTVNRGVLKKLIVDNEKQKVNGIVIDKVRTTV
jgi:post-segregation antitoxin (ccd killing protein)